MTEGTKRFLLQALDEEYDELIRHPELRSSTGLMQAAAAICTVLEYLPIREKLMAPADCD